MQPQGLMEIANGDLWRECQQPLACRAPHEVSFKKVKGHAKWRDVWRGSVQEEDKVGNDMADSLATAGAAMHDRDQMLVNR
eukprot:5170375-Karenia_brevis.AAC.1